MAMNYQQDGHTLDWTNDSGALVVSGQPVAVGGIVGVAHDDIPVDETGVLHTSGVFVLEKGAEEVTPGQALYLAAGVLTAAAAGEGEGAAANPLAGSAWSAATADETEVAVRLGF